MIHFGVFALMMFSVPSQRSPYLHSSDPGVLPQYLPKGTTDKREINANKEPYGGTLETKEVYDRVSKWPDAKKPFWYINAIAKNKQLKASS